MLSVIATIAHMQLKHRKKPVSTSQSLPTVSFLLVFYLNDFNRFVFWFQLFLSFFLPSFLPSHLAGTPEVSVSSLHAGLLGSFNMCSFCVSPRTCDDSDIH